MGEIVKTKLIKYEKTSYKLAKLSLNSIIWIWKLIKKVLTLIVKHQINNLNKKFRISTFKSLKLMMRKLKQVIKSLKIRIRRSAAF